MRTWNDIHDVRIPTDAAVLVRQENGVESFGCYHSTHYSSGIIQLTYNKCNDSFDWNGQTYLLCVTHWRDIDIDDLKEAV